jgi:predicted nucleic acid-binding protein
MYESREETVELEPPASGLRYVILDTSAVYHDFDLSNRETVMLLQSAERHGFRVCVPEVVIQEMTAHCLEQLEKTRRDLVPRRRDAVHQGGVDANGSHV